MPGDGEEDAGEVGGEAEGVGGADGLWVAEAAPVSAEVYCKGYPRRSAYETARADLFRQQLFEMLGPECGLCGEPLEGLPWEVNHIYPREWKPSKLSKYRRNLRYLKEARDGLVNLCCKACNAAYRPGRAGTPPAPLEPF